MKNRNDDKRNREDEREKKSAEVKKRSLRVTARGIWVVLHAESGCARVVVKIGLATAAALFLFSPRVKLIGDYCNYSAEV